MIKAAFTCALAWMLAAVPASAHHPQGTIGTVRITQPVMAGGTVLQPGTYEVRDTGEHGKPLPGQSAEAQSVVEFVSNGTVVAKDVAEVMPAAERPVGTSSASTGRATVQMLKGGEFMRISANVGSERYLIHLPLARH